MARSGVTYHQVVKAAESLRVSGHEPTVDRIREQIGSGSKSTIAPLLKKWRTGTASAVEMTGLPSDLVDAVQSLHARAQQAAQHRIDTMRTEYDCLRDKLHQQLVESRNQNGALLNQCSDLEQQVGGLTVHSEQQSAALDAAHLVIARATAQREESDKRIAEMQALIADLRREKKNLFDHFEHYQQRVSEDRHIEREQYRSTHLQMQTQLNTLTSHLAQAETRSDALVADGERMQQHIDKLNERCHELEMELQSSCDALQRCKDDIKSLAVEKLVLEKRNSDLLDRVDAASTRITVAEKEIAVLNAENSRIAEALSVAHGTIEAVSADKQFLIKENAMIQGQFKQLQSSL